MILFILIESSTELPNSYFKFKNKPFYTVAKRLVETVIALLILAILSPLWLVIALLIKVTSPGPVLYQGRVVGKGGKEFTYYKFRSMQHNNDNSQHQEFIKQYVGKYLKVETIADVVDNATIRLQSTYPKTSDAEGSTITPFEDNKTHKLPHSSANPADTTTPTSLPLSKLTNDKRITKIGQLIRKFSVDEVPQLFNVIKGEMAIVGPRPPVPYEYGMYNETCKQRLQVLPGITGLAQVRKRNQASFQQMLEIDFEYIERRSLLLDWQIMLKTPIVMLKGV
jgi:lipopolysaccharide/colanic/teichoic acid biosynthesis glycosyltransferase